MIKRIVIAVCFIAQVAWGQGFARAEARRSDAAFHTVSVTYPDRLKTEPKLLDRLRGADAEVVSGFERVEAERTYPCQANREPVHSLIISYEITADTPSLIGLVRRTMLRQYGAHEDDEVRGIIWDRHDGRIIGPRDLFGAALNPRRLQADLCRRLDLARKARASQPA